MSNRFHNKWHRTNHHTYTNVNNPDAGHDPIASQVQPFLGEFVLLGSLSAVAPLSAYAAHFYSNNTAVCAIGGVEGIYVTGTRDAIRAFSENIAVSAYSPKIGILVASPNRSIWANSGYIGLDIFSNNKAISARGLLIGLEVSSPVRALSAFSNFIGTEIYSLDRAISAFGFNIGGEFYSNNIGLSSFGSVNGLKVESPQKAILASGSNIGAEIRSTNRGLSAFGANIGGEFYSTNIPLSTAFGKNLLHGSLGVNTDNPTSALDVLGDTILRGNERVTGNVRVDQDLTIYGNLSTLGSITYLDTRVMVTSSMDIRNIGTGPALTVTQLGEQPVAQFYDETGHTAFYVEGTTEKPGWVGVGTSNLIEALTVDGSIYGTGNFTIVGDLSANNGVFRNDLLARRNLTVYENLSGSKDLTINGNVSAGNALGKTFNVSGGAFLVDASGEVTAAYTTGNSSTSLLTRANADARYINPLQSLLAVSYRPINIGAGSAENVGLNAPTYANTGIRFQGTASASGDYSGTVNTAYVSGVGVGALVDFNSRFAVEFWYSQGTNSANVTFHVHLGTNDRQNLTDRGIGLKINCGTGQVTAQVHNGTTLTNSATLGSNIGNLFFYRYLLTWDGVQTLSVYAGRADTAAALTLLGTVSAGSPVSGEVSSAQIRFGYYASGPSGSAQDALISAVNFYQY